MGIEEIKTIIGADPYHEVAASARRVAPFTGAGTHTDAFDSMVPHDINDLIWDSSLSDRDKVTLTLRVYRDIPCYALLMGIKLNYDDLSRPAQDLFWEQVRIFLEHSDEALAAPVAYTLWCDYFEGVDTVERAWAEVIREGPSDRRLQRVLIVSGPVPFALKERLYAELIPEPKWHYYIFRSLLHSAFDYFGNIDRQKALAILRQLDLPSDTVNLSLLRDTLASDCG